MFGGDSVAERRRSIEDLSKDELLALFQKIKMQTTQISNDKKEAVQQAEFYRNERDDMKLKAQQLVLRCKDLEEKLRLMAIREESHQSEIDALTRGRLSEDPTAEPLIRELEMKLTIAHDEIFKYKMGMDTAIPKLKELRVLLETKTFENEKCKEENAQLRQQVDSLSYELGKSACFMFVLLSS